MRNWIDLHMHSFYSSDGTYSPAELIGLCKAAGLKVVALTDHNAIAGVAEMMRCGQQIGIEVIPGSEFDCQFEGRFLHILCYGVDPQDERIHRHAAMIHNIELDAARQILDKAKKLGLFFEEEKVLALSRDGTVCGEMIAEVALADPRNAESELLKPYRPGGQRSNNPFVNFYWDHCSPGKAAYVYMDYPPFERVMELIEAVGGTAVLAHPGANVGHDAAYIRKLQSCGVVGLEVYSSYHSAEDIGYFLQAAHELGLFVTVGSDFHGKTKPAVRMADFELENQQDILNTFLRFVRAR